MSQHPKPCPRCTRVAAELSRAQDALHDLAKNAGEGAWSSLLQAAGARADVAATERDRWREFSLRCLARFGEEIPDDIRLLWKRLGDDGLLELVFCAKCARGIEGTGFQVLTDDLLEQVSRMERRAG